MVCWRRGRLTPGFFADCLATGEHPNLLTVLEAAIRWGKPPGFMMHGRETWGDRDRVAALGYELYKQMRCPECGHLLTVCRDRDNDFTVTTDVCRAKRAVDEYTNRDQYKPAPGEVLYPVLDDATDSGEDPGARPW